MSIQAVSPLLGTGASAKANPAVLVASKSPRPIARGAILGSKQRFISNSCETSKGRKGALDGLFIAFSGANPERLIERRDEDFAVADLTGPGGRGDRVDRFTDEIAWHGDLDLQLGEKAHRIFSPAVN